MHLILPCQNSKVHSLARVEGGRHEDIGLHVPPPGCCPVVLLATSPSGAPGEMTALQYATALHCQDRRNTDRSISHHGLELASRARYTHCPCWAISEAELDGPIKMLMSCSKVDFPEGRSKHSKTSNSNSTACRSTPRDRHRSVSLRGGYPQTIRGGALVLT